MIVTEIIMFFFTCMFIANVNKSILLKTEFVSDVYVHVVWVCVPVCVYVCVLVRVSMCMCECACVCFCV
jgi:hypothetical protein